MSLIEAYENSLKEHLKEFNIKTYLGEFNDKEKIEALFNKDECLVFFDFINESFLNVSQREITYKIYVCSKTSNKQRAKREECKYKALDKLSEIERALIDTFFINGYKVDLLSLAKEYDNATDLGFIVLYSRTFKTILQENNHTGLVDEL
ncbi:hypothetical protein AVBRAN12640_05360 [Campylobacter sp. RM12640]|uniref:hypothetical protein n=1 Tax=unclassified Campylobacter TaxID=2593542 RepID=UPI0030147ACE|nr:hypothetical protein [Campylobacter sp. RM12640]MBZ7990000.1 hypothetical protein [Campylobacter sp. RM12635]